MRIFLFLWIALLIMNNSLAGDKPAAALFSLTVRAQPGDTQKGINKQMYYAKKTDITKTARFEVELRNLGKSRDTFTLDYYFTCQSLDTGEYRIFDYASKSYGLDPMEAAKDVFESSPIKKKIFSWMDVNRWESGDKQGGFVAILKDDEGKTLTTRAQPAKLQSLISTPDKLAAFLSGTNNIPPHDDVTPRTEPAPMMPRIDVNATSNR